MDKKKILVVDDEPDLVKMLKLRLEENNYDVLVASDGREALRKARKENPDLIILDLMLPKMDGYKVCRMLKFDMQHKHIPIIMFTARAQDVDKKLGYEVGADEYIIKPFRGEDLLLRIRKILKQ